MTPQDALDTIFTTDYQMDKVVASYTGSFTANARYGLFNPRRSTTSFAHNLGSYMLPVGVYSYDGGATWTSFGTVLATTSGGHPDFQTIEVNGFCNSSDVGVAATNWTDTTRTIMYAIQLISRD